MPYLESTRPTFQTPSAAFHLLCGWLFCMPTPLRVGVESRGGSSVRSDSHACYNDTVHDHRSQARPLKTQHNSSADKSLTILAACLPFYLWHSRVQNFKCASRCCVHKTTQSLKTRVVSSWISVFFSSSSFFFSFCFSSHPLEWKPQSFFSHHKSFTDNWGRNTFFFLLLLLCRVHLCSRVRVPVFMCRAAGGGGVSLTLSIV